MGNTNTKKDVKIIKQFTPNYPKKQYINAKKAVATNLDNKRNIPPFSLDGKCLEEQLSKIASKDKKDSPRKKVFKNEISSLKPFELDLKLNSETSTTKENNKKSPRLHIARNSISYNGEFAIKLQQVANNANEEGKETKKVLKDLSCFEKIKVIGRGTFGKVILVRSKLTNQLLALKCIKKSQILKNKNIENIKNEKKILKNLDNPFIIKLHYTFQDNDKIFMAFDYYNGGELFFHLQKQKRFSENLTRFYASEIYLALNYLHKNKIIYRDLKPENIILDKTGHIKLIDFGLAKGDITPLSLTGTICGTNEYIPPEVINGNRYGFSFDWWGFGNILYEMLFGYPPFTDQNKPNLFKKIVKKEPLYKGANISPDALDLLVSLLKKDPKDRIKPEDIPCHRWFKGIDFDQIYNLKIVPPFQPKIKNEEDLSNIDPTFLNECVNSPIKAFNQDYDKDYFSDF